MKKKIGIIESGFMSSYLKEFINLCQKENIRFDLFTNYFNSNFAEYAQNVYRLNSCYLPKNFESKCEVENEIKKLVDINDYDYFLTDCMGLSFTCNIFHNISLTQRMFITKNFLYRKILQFFHRKQIQHEKEYYKNCPKIFVVSNYLKNDYSKNCGINPEKISVVYPGTSNKKVLSITGKKTANTFTIGAVTCGFTTKGGYNILGALRILKKKYSFEKIKVKIINPNAKKQKLLQFYIKVFGLGKYVEFLPYQNDVNLFYKSLDCLICASNYEAFGRVVTEGMLCRVPVIVGSNVGASDIIKDGENGFIYDAENTYKNLAQKIEEVMAARYDKEKLLDNAESTAKQLSWKSFAEDIFYNLYSKTEVKN